MKKYLITAFAALLIVAGCKKDSNNPIQNNPVKKEGIVPLAKGNTWIYHQKFFDTTGNITSEKDFTNQIMQIVQYQGEDWYSYDTGQSYYPLYKLKSDGLWQIPQPPYGVITPMLFYKYPCVLLETYNNWKVLSEKININVLAGNFDCVLYQYSAGSGYTEECYVSYGLGLVKKDGKNANGNVYNSYELISYTLK
jgi:hypothetical protein